jgi:aminocarboxymuconate-semialdehyde decarboxylase
MTHSPDSGIIDLHGHIVLEGSMGTAGWCGPTIGSHPDGTPFFQVGNYRLDGVAYRGSLFIETDLRLAAMDEQGISVQALSPNPLTYLHFIDAALAIDFCQAHNDNLAATVRRHPDRFVGLAALPMQDIEAACRELRRAVAELGLLGGYIGTDFGTFLDAPEMDPLYSLCVELDVPLFIHPTQSGIDGPLRDPRVRRWDLDLVLEYGFEELLAVSTLVFGGVTERFPTLDICLSHGGGFTSMAMGKLRKLAERRKAAPEWIHEPGAFDRALGRLWFDCHVTGGNEFAFALQQLGTAHLVYGTNFGGWDKGTGPDVAALRPTLNSNAVDLMRLGRRAPSLAARFR